MERILSMVDGALLLVDASEGPMPQTKFVLAKALKRGLRPIVVINKVDKPDQRALEVQTEVFDLFALLDADDSQLDFPTLFASAKHGWADESLDGPRTSMEALYRRIVAHVQAPVAVEEGPFAMLATTLESDPYVGRVLTGRIHSGVARVNMPVKALRPDGTVIEESRLTKLLAFRGIERTPIEEAEAGDIVAIAGLEAATVADTLAIPRSAKRCPRSRSIRRPWR